MVLNFDIQLILDFSLYSISQKGHNIGNKIKHTYTRNCQKGVI
jgi:hypothetical protein